MTDVTPAPKLCPKCGRVKTADQFHARSDRPDKLQNRCKDCAKKYRQGMATAHAAVTEKMGVAAGIQPPDAASRHRLGVKAKRYAKAARRRGFIDRVITKAIERRKVNYWQTVEARADQRTATAETEADMARAANRALRRRSTALLAHVDQLVARVNEIEGRHTKAAEAVLAKRERAARTQQIRVEHDRDGLVMRAMAVDDPMLKCGYLDLAEGVDDE